MKRQDCYRLEVDIEEELKFEAPGPFFAVAFRSICC